MDARIFLLVSSERATARLSRLLRVEFANSAGRRGPSAPLATQDTHRERKRVRERSWWQKRGRTRRSGFRTARLNEVVTQRIQFQGTATGQRTSIRTASITKQHSFTIFYYKKKYISLCRVYISPYLQSCNATIGSGEGKHENTSYI